MLLIYLAKLFGKNRSQHFSPDGSSEFGCCVPNHIGILVSAVFVKANIKKIPLGKV